LSFQLLLKLFHQHFILIVIMHKRHLFGMHFHLVFRNFTNYHFITSIPINSLFFRKHFLSLLNDSIHKLCSWYWCLITKYRWEMKEKVDVPPCVLILNVFETLCLHFHLLFLCCFIIVYLRSKVYDLSEFFTILCAFKKGFDNKVLHETEIKNNVQ